ncbi:MAG: sigma-70 family RNA polymerase sigma factor [Ruminococcus sp.]|nr:sigma-70 family RNA polymerase sigma factor [Ruminococcus sp.]
MNGKTVSDNEIISLYFARRQQAVALSREKYGAYCFEVARNILSSREDSEECVNDTWLAAWNVIPPQKPARLKMFFAKITRNSALDLVRRQGAKKRGSGEFAMSLEELSECLGGRSVEEELDAKSLGECVNGFLKSLPQKDRRIFLRRYFFADSAADIAKRYGVTPNAAAVSLCRTREKLREHLKKEGFLS